MQGRVLDEKGALTKEDKREWQEVRMLILDEVSFICDDEMKKMDQRLK